MCGAREIEAVRAVAHRTGEMGQIIRCCCGKPVPVLVWQNSGQASPSGRSTDIRTPMLDMSISLHGCLAKLPSGLTHASIL
jgi:hypothetical protein